MKLPSQKNSAKFLPLPSTVKEHIVQDPALMDYIFKKNNLKKEEHASLLCYLDAAYGESANKRDTALTAVTARMSGVAISVLEASRQIEKECKEASEFNLTGTPSEANQCSGTSLEREMEENNCFQGAMLPAMKRILSYMTNPGEMRLFQMLVANRKEARDVKLWHKSRKPQNHFQKMIALRQEGKAAEATAYEQKLKS